MHCSRSVVGRVLIVGASVFVGLKLGCCDGASVVGEDVGNFVDGVRVAGLCVVGSRVGRGITGLLVVGFDVGFAVG